MEEQVEDRERYCLEVFSMSAITWSVSSTFLPTSAASVFSVSKVLITLSSSRIRPLASLRQLSKFFSRCLNLSWNSPCYLSRLLLFWSMSGRSAFRTWLRH